MKDFNVYAVHSTAPAAGKVSMSVELERDEEHTAYALLTPDECRALAGDLLSAARFADIRGGAS